VFQNSLFRLVESAAVRDSLAEQDGFEPPVPVVRSEAASSCQFQILHTIDGAPEAGRRTTGSAPGRGNPS
jgi:hypothetical protein